MTLADVYSMIINNFIGFILIIARVSGIFTFNPIFGRANVPARVKMGITVVLAILFASSMGDISYAPTSTLVFIFDILKEVAFGLVLGFMVNLILTVLIFAGEMIDTQTGLGMAKAMDPTTGVTMPIFANVYYYMFVLYFFITNGHLSYIKLFRISYESVPMGFESLNIDVAFTIVSYLSVVLTLAVKFALPLIAAEMIVEICLGVLMKAVPSIHLFVINIQLKVIMGLFLLMVIAAPMSDFIEDLMNIMWQNLFGLMPIIGN